MIFQVRKTITFAVALCTTTSALAAEPYRNQTKNHTGPTAPAAASPAVSRTPPSGREAKREEAENLIVTAGVASANGVTNTTPGGGLMPPQTDARAQSGITRDYIAKQAPTSNVQSLIAALPGVVAAKSDPLGVTGDSLSIRGFNERETGYLFEGIPVADPLAYSPYTNIIVDSENMGGVTLTQGASDISAPLYNAIGAQISMKAIDPAKKAGGYIEASGGTRGANKEFIRLNTGEIGNTGVTGFASFSYTSSNSWHGPGGLRRYHIDAELTKAWGRGSDAKIWFSYNNSMWNPYRVATMAQWQTLGRSLNLSSTYTPGNTLYYKLNYSATNAIILGAPVNLHLAKGLDLHITPYFTDFFGPSRSGQNLSEDNSYFGTVPAGPLNQPYATNGVITAQAVDPWIQLSGGLSTWLGWKYRTNTFKIGYWYAYTNHTERQSFTPVDYDGNSANNAGRYAIVLQNGRVLSGYDDTIRQQTNSIFISDNLKLLHDKLSITAGLKTTMVSRWATDLVPGAMPYRSARNYFAPMPQFSASYEIDKQDQIYINGTTAFRAPAGSFVQIFSPSSKVAITQPGTLKAQYSIGEEIGYRHTGLWNLSVALFNYNMTHRQVTSSAYIPGTTNLVSSSLDAGGQTSRGVQAEFGLRPWHHFSPYLSGQYLHATIDSNYQVGSDFLPTKGKTAVLSPKFTGTIGLQYDDGFLFGNASIHYVDSQYSTFMNDQAIHSYVTSDMTLGMRFRNVAFAKHPQVQLNLINIGDNHYLSGISGFGGAAKSTKGIYGSTIAASTPTYVIGGGFAALVSVGSGF